MYFAIDLYNEQIFKKLGAVHQLEAVKRKKRERYKWSASLSFVNLKEKKKVEVANYGNSKK
jgi:hypothetical protein